MNSNKWDSTSNTAGNYHYETIEPDTEIPNVASDTRAHEDSSKPSSGLPGLSFGSSFDFSKSFAPFTNSNEISKTNKISERQYAGGNTLDEPVWETLRRDMMQIARRIAIVIWPMQISSLAMHQQQRFIDFALKNGINIPELLRSTRIPVPESEDSAEQEEGLSADEALWKNSLDWDLWGPLLFSLLYSVTLGLSASSNQTNIVFSGTFSLIWVFYIIIGLNVQLLGGNISFMSAISAAGYSMFPVTVGALLCTLLIKYIILRIPLMIFLCSWSIYAGFLSLKCSGVLPGRVFLAIYPVSLIYSALSWLCIIT